MFAIAFIIIQVVQLQNLIMSGSVYLCGKCTTRIKGEIIPAAHLVYTIVTVSNEFFFLLPFLHVCHLLIWHETQRLLSHYRLGNFVKLQCRIFFPFFVNTDGSRYKWSSWYEGRDPKCHRWSPVSTDQSDWQAGHPTGAQWDEDGHERYEVTSLYHFPISFMY